MSHELVNQSNNLLFALEQIGKLQDRITSLFTRMMDMQTDLDRIRARLAELEGKIS